MLQLGRAGLPQQLVTLMTDVTQQLLHAQAEQEAAATATTTTSSSSSSSSRASSVDVSDLLDMSGILLMTHEKLIVTTASGPFFTAAALAAGVQLALASLQHLDWLLQCKQQQQQQQQGLLSDGPDYSNIERCLFVKTCGTYLQQALLRYCALPDLHLWDVLPTATANFGLLTQVMMYRDRLHKLQLQLPGSDSSSSNCSSSGADTSGGGGSSKKKKKGRKSSGSSTTAPAAAAAAVSDKQLAEWALGVAVTHHQQMPGPPPYLSECIGLSKLVLTWVAALSLQGKILGGNGLPLLLTFWEVICSRVMPLDQEERSQLHEQLLARHQQQQQDEAKALFSVQLGMAQLDLAGLLLQEVAALDSSDLGNTQYTNNAVLSAGCVLMNFGYHFRHQRWLRWQQQHGEQGHSSDGTAAPLCSCCGKVAADPTANSNFVSMLTPWTATTLPTLIKVMTAYLSEAQKAAAAAAAGSASAGNEASAGASGGVGGPTADSSSSSSAAAAAAAQLAGMMSTLSNCAQLLSEMGKVGAAKIDDATGQNGNAGIRYVGAAAWELHALDVVSWLEQYVRLLASARDVSFDMSYEDGPDKRTSIAREFSSPTADVAPRLCLPHQHTPGVLMLLAGASRPSSPLYAKLMSLQGSVLKLAGTCSWAWSAFEGVRCCAMVSDAAARMLDLQQHWLAGLINSSTAVAAVAANSADASSSSSSSCSNGAGATGTGGHSAADYAAGLPWLVLVGRCCYHWAIVMGQSDLVDQHQQQKLADSSKQTELEYLLDALDSLAAGMGKRCRVLVGAQQLLAAGYGLQPVEQQWLAVCEAKQAVQGAVAGLTGRAAHAGVDAARAAVADLASGLRLFGLAASTVPVPDYCNNPGCVNVGGASEAALVLGKGCMCGGCRVAHYCSRACQRQHWKLHKPACQALAGAKAATAPAAATTT